MSVVRLDKTKSESVFRVLYKRILLKISGEFLAGTGKLGFQSQQMESIAQQLAELAEEKIEIGIVVGGGNLVRGRQLQEHGVNKMAGDQMGMLATIINGIALRDALQKKSVRCRLVSAISVTGILERHNPLNTIRYLRDGEVVIYCGGTGNPFFTTDTAACLRAIEIEADILLKGTKVDGIYNRDPQKNADAKKYELLAYAEVLSRELEVMDITAVALARDNTLPIRVFSIMKEGALKEVVRSESLGTLIRD